jgi:hypothetical protein
LQFRKDKTMFKKPPLPEGYKVTEVQDIQCLELFSLRRASLRLKINYRELLQAVNEERIPYYKLGRSRRLVSLQEVLAYMRFFPHRLTSEDGNQPDGNMEDVK